MADINLNSELSTCITQNCRYSLEGFIEQFRYVWNQRVDFLQEYLDEYLRQYRDELGLSRRDIVDYCEQILPIHWCEAIRFWYTRWFNPPNQIPNRCNCDGWWLRWERELGLDQTEALDEFMLLMSQRLPMSRQNRRFITPLNVRIDRNYLNEYHTFSRQKFGVIYLDVKKQSLLLVKSKLTFYRARQQGNKLSIPKGGRLYLQEDEMEAAYREFYEETRFKIQSDPNFPSNSPRTIMQARSKRRLEFIAREDSIVLFIIHKEEWDEDRENRVSRLPRPERANVRQNACGWTNYHRMGPQMDPYDEMEDRGWVDLMNFVEDVQYRRNPDAQYRRNNWSMFEANLYNFETQQSYVEENLDIRRNTTRPFKALMLNPDWHDYVFETLRITFDPDLLQNLIP